MKPDANHCDGSGQLTRRAACLALGFGLLAGPSSAQTEPAGWREVAEKARVEARVNLYSAAVPQQIERLIAAFNRKHPGIRVVHTRGVSEMPARIATERETNTDGGDAFIFYDPLWFDANAEILLPLDSPAAQAFPQNGWRVSNKAAYVAHNPFGMLVWNTNFVKQPLTHYDDLLRPEFRGRVGTREGRDAVLSGFLEFLEREVGPEHLAALAKQNPKFYASGVPLNQAVASGEVWVANVGLPGVLNDLKAQGAPIAWTTAKPYGFANPWVAAVLSHSKRPNAARLFVDFTLTPEGQTALCGENSCASVLPGLPGTFNLADYKLLEAEKYPAAVVDEWRRKFDAIFRK
jgi:iron(III) transport system substrate-binding protein